jgi:NAD(P)-dependent dehydrogenase (short-subunit alcohol dehydrogenase family)
LAQQGWSLVLDARHEPTLARAEAEIRALLTGGAHSRSVAGDVTDAGHRRALAASAEALGGLDLLVNNASTLGRSPLPRLAAMAPATLRRVFEVNAIAPLALIQETLPLLRRSTTPRIMNITSDASVEHYDTWGGYGSSKAALDHLSATLAVEEPAIQVWVVDPGDMRTDMHQDAFAGEDISDRPEPDSVVPTLLDLVASVTPSGRFQAARWAATVGGGR